MIQFLRIITAGIVATVTVVALAGPGINYQAKLAGAGGGLLQGSHSIYFSIWDGGTSNTANSGTQVFGESTSITVSNGIVNHVLGTGTDTFGNPLSSEIFSPANEMYLQVAVDTSGNVILPRTVLGAAPFAFKSLESSNGNPTGAIILGTTSTAPIGYSFTGKTIYDSWVPLRDMITKRRDLAVVAASQEIFAIGGTAATGFPVATNEAYNPATNSWRARKDMPTSRSLAGGVELGGLIYVTGGAFFGTRYDVNEVYNPATNTWATMQHLLTNRDSHSAAAVNGKMYVFGGYNFTSGPLPLATVEEYDPGANIWTPKASMPTPRASTSAAALNGLIYVMGGLPANNITTSVVEIYNPANNTWITGTPAMDPFFNAGATAVDGGIYVIGGRDTPVFADTRIYDPQTATWLPGLTMPEARQQVGVTNLNGRIFVIGGSDPSNSFSSLNRALDPTIFYAYSKN